LTKFQLEDYRFDTQFLTVVMEDTISGEHDQVYVPDPDGSIGLDPEITLPGFKVGKPKMQIASNTYPTNFGDLADPEATAYSRLTLSIPVTRPIMAMSVKTFVPIVLLVVCAALVFFVRPHYVEGRIGLGITALLTLVALQLTSSASLPDVDYLMMLDQPSNMLFDLVLEDGHWRINNIEKTLSPRWTMSKILLGAPDAFPDAEPEKKK
jgi:hypothetical protein